MVQQGIFRSPYMLQRSLAGGSEDPIAALIGNALQTYTGLREKKQSDALAAQRVQDENSYRQQLLDTDRERNRIALIGHYLGQGYVPGADGSPSAAQPPVSPSATPTPPAVSTDPTQQGPASQGPSAQPVAAAVGAQLAKPNPLAPPPQTPGPAPVPPTTTPDQINVSGVGPMVRMPNKQMQLDAWKRNQQETELRTTGAQAIRARLGREPTSDDEALTAGKTPGYVDKLYAESPQGMAQAATADSLKTAASTKAKIVEEGSPAALKAAGDKAAADKAAQQGVETADTRRMAEVGANAARIHLDMKAKETSKDWSKTQADVIRAMSLPQLAEASPHFFGGKAAPAVDAAKQLGISPDASAYINDIWQMQDARQLSIGSKSLGRSPELLRQGFREFGQNIGEGPAALAQKQEQRLGVIRMAKASGLPSWNAALKTHGLTDDQIFAPSGFQFKHTQPGT